MKDLTTAMAFINRHYTFDGKSYPDLKESNSDKRFNFGVRHSVLHMQKSLGKIAEYAEATDHGQSLLDPQEALNEPIVKMFVNVLKLASLNGYSAEQLLAAVPSVVKIK